MKKAIGIVMVIFFVTAGMGTLQAYADRIFSAKATRLVPQQEYRLTCVRLKLMQLYGMLLDGTYTIHQAHSRAKLAVQVRGCAFERIVLISGEGEVSEPEPVTGLGGPVEDPYEGSPPDCPDGTEACVICIEDEGDPESQICYAWCCDVFTP